VPELYLSTFQSFVRFLFFLLCQIVNPEKIRLRQTLPKSRFRRCYVILERANCGWLQ
jgi:hypothetical protein